MLSSIRSSWTFLSISLISLKAQPAMTDSIISAPHQLEKRFWNNIGNKIKDRCSLIDQSERDEMWNAAVYGSSSSNHLLNADYWSSRNYDQVKVIALNELLSESIKSHQQQALVVLNLSKKIIDEGTRDSARSTGSIHNPLSLLNGGNPTSSPPASFSKLNYAIQQLSSVGAQCLDEGAEMTHWTPVVLKILISTMRRRDLQADEWKGWRDVMFGQFISIAFEQDAISGKDILTELGLEEEWWAKALEKAAKTNSLENHGIDLIASHTWWDEMKKSLLKIERLEADKLKLID